MSSIPGLEHLEKDGWELVRVGVPVFNVDWIVDPDGKPRFCDFDSMYMNRVIIRKIEKPKQYRAFENAAEYMPHWGKPVKYQDSLGFDSIISTSELGVYTAQGRMVQFLTMGQAFGSLTFADGSPFGVEVTS